ncbi:Crp/Fnr family transcriptional regulator [Dyadobacter psychrotolerans]|uniref:Crp/Fnr family transcriptional regulator n=1 Tax=Dyadobacter psychrotolerans TaxID=2541721 RepID=A0A4R5DF13_9BACT|nr:hypothetical protein [Dyadobacter psychrotolerans]TDE11747.1 hypothetical protein E0F88_25335 [Dyadobacter psychrotolerans]
MEGLLHTLTQLTRLPGDQLKSILHYFIPATVPRGIMLLVPGVMFPPAWLIGSGSLRAFYQVEENKRTRTAGTKEKLIREITNWIVPEGGILTDIRSHLHQVPSQYYIEALEPCKLYSLSYDHYLAIRTSHPTVAQALFEDPLAMADLRVQMCNLRDAAARFEMFENTYPGLKGRLSVNIQASFLNIDPTTLSRLRAKK